MAELRFEGTPAQHGGQPCARILLTDTRITLGRSPDNDLVLPDSQVSKHHAVLEPDPESDSYWLIDAGSRNRIIHNHRPVDRVLLSDGDRFSIGRITVRFRLDTSADSLEIVDDQEETTIGPQVIEGSEGPLVSPGRGSPLHLIAALADLVGSVGDRQVLRERILDLVFSSLDVDRALIAIRDRGTGELTPEARRRAHRSRAREDVLRISGSVVKMVVEGGKAVISQDASADFGGESIGQYGIGSVMCAPLRRDREVAGIVYVDALHRNVRFTPEDQQFFLAIAAVIGATLESRQLIDRLERQNRAYLRELAARGETRICQQSPAMERILLLGARYARSPDERAPILITGERGTGKTHIARFLHEQSRRADRPFQLLDCASIPEGLAGSALYGHVKGAFTGASESRKGAFRAADGGDLFLDEVGELPLPLQASLLVAIRDGLITPVGTDEPVRVDVRVIAATNRNLEAMVAEGSFRADLLDRLRVLPLHLPPLREHPEDIPLLARHFLAMHGGVHEDGRTSPLDLEASAEAALRAWPWEGNVAEVENLMRQLIATVDGPTIAIQDLPEPMRRQPALPLEGMRSLAQVEREHLQRTLERTAGNIKRAAQVLGIHRDTLAAKMKKHGLR